MDTDHSSSFVTCKESQYKLQSSQAGTRFQENVPIVIRGVWAVIVLEPSRSHAQKVRMLKLSPGFALPLLFVAFALSAHADPALSVNGTVTGLKQVGGFPTVKLRGYGTTSGRRNNSKRKLCPWERRLARRWQN
jgi:hypothetical protein